VRAIFLDRDGVICENRSDHVKAWEEFRFLPGALAGLARLAETDFATIVITNQAIVNRGMVAANVIDGIHARMLTTVRRAGGRIDRVMVCPHRSDEYCACRKPQPGMLLQAAAELGIDLVGSYMIGDAMTDMQAGLAAGCRCIMVMTGRGRTQSARTTSAQGEFRLTHDLQHAVELIRYLEAFGVERLTPIPSSAITRPLALPTLPAHALR